MSNNEEDYVIGKESTMAIVAGRMRQRAELASEAMFENKAWYGRHNELIAAAFLVECGFYVYLPFKDKGVDLIAVDDSGEALRFEVRTPTPGTWNKNFQREKHYDRVDYYISVCNGLYCRIYTRDGIEIGTERGYRNRAHVIDSQDVKGVKK